MSGEGFLPSTTSDKGKSQSPRRGYVQWGLCRRVDLPHEDCTPRIGDIGDHGIFESIVRMQRLTIVGGMAGSHQGPDY